MGEELEIYILKKLDDAIKECNSSEFHLAARLFLPNLHKDFTELRELIEKKRTKIKKAAAAAASKKESTTGPSNSPARPLPRPAVRDPAANVAKIPDVSKSSAPAATTAKEESKVLLSAGGVKKSEAPRDAADEKKIGAPTDAGNKKDTGAPLDSGEDKKDAGALSDAGGYKKDTGAPLNAGDKKESGAHLDAGDKKDTDAPLDSKEDKKDAGALLDAGDKKNSGVPLDAGDEKESGTPLDSKEDKKDAGALSDADGYKKGIGASLDAGDKKDSGPPQDAGDEKESGTPEDAAPSDAAPSDAGDKKETDTPLDGGDKNETDAASDVVGDKNETDAAGDKKESSAPSDATCDEKDTDAPLAESAKKESDAPLARTYSKTTSPDESKASAPARAYVTSGGATDQHESDTHTTAAAGGKKESNVGTSAKSTSQDESEISPATDAVTGDKSITPPAAAAAGDGEKESNASKTATLAKTSTDESEISPVTDDDATDHKSKTPTSVGDGKKESGNEENLLREQLYYLNNVLAEWQMITKKPFSYSSDSLSSMKDLSKTLKKIKQDLKPETTKKTEESSHSGIPPTPEVVEYRWSTRLVNLEKVYGFEDKILSLERLLVLGRKDTDTFKAFGIHGMAGVGKTTLCQSIFSGPKVSKYFFPRIWVCLSKQKGEDQDNKKEVVKRMLRCLGIDDKIINKVDDKKCIRGLLFALRLQLTGKRYLIVLDDAHNEDEWFKMPDSDTENDNNNKIYEKFSYGLPKECGGTVIVTSRVEKVVKNMVGDEENLRCIEPLTDEDTCWKIFKDTVEEDGTEFPEDLNINTLKLEIVKRCDGLPLAAKLLGQIKHKELVENPTLAGTQRAAGNQQATVEAAK